MTSIVHLANTNLEFELASPSQKPFETLRRNPVCMQLQYLPALFASSEDGIAVTALPDSAYLEALEQSGWRPDGLPKFILLNDFVSLRGKTCQSWGSSQQVKAWTKECGMHYEMPPFEIVQKVNSKAFSFRYSSLADAAIIENEAKLKDWLEKVKGPKVIKTCFGLSGKGNWRIDDNQPLNTLLNVCRNEWQQRRPVIGEPWVDRVYDFSTQWHIDHHGTVKLIGATRFETDDRGIYRGTLAGPVDLLFSSLKPYLCEHLKIAEKALNEAASLGYFGFAGIDALIYRHHDHSLSLYPLVEINGRETMSLVALRMQQRTAPSGIVRLVFQNKVSEDNSLLPMQMADPKGKIIHFSHSLTASLQRSVDEISALSLEQ